MAKRGTALQLNIIELLAEGKSRQEISDILGCCLKSIDDAKGDPELKRLYYEKCNAQVEQLVPLAIQRLHGILKDDSQQGSVVIAAVREVLDRSHLQELLDKPDNEIKVVVSYE